MLQLIERTELWGSTRSWKQISQPLVMQQRTREDPGVRMIASPQRFTNRHAEAINAVP